MDENMIADDEADIEYGEYLALQKANTDQEAMFERERFDDKLEMYRNEY